MLKDDAYPGAKAGDQVFASILSANLDVCCYFSHLTVLDTYPFSASLSITDHHHQLEF